MKKLVLSLLLITVSSAANAATVVLVSHETTTLNGNIVSLITDGSHVSGIAPASTATWQWDGSTLTGTGFYGATNSIDSLSTGLTVISDQVTDLVISTGGTPGGTASATAYNCVEGAFLSGVGANGCGGYVLGPNLIDESTTVWGPGTAVSQTLVGDDFIDPAVFYVGARSVSYFDFGLDGLVGDGLHVGDLITLGNGLEQGTDKAETMVFQVTAAVPVPAAVWLFGSALGLLGWMKRKTS